MDGFISFLFGADHRGPFEEDWGEYDDDGYCGGYDPPEVGDTHEVDCRECGEPLTLTFNANGKWQPTDHQCPALLDLLPDLP